MIASLVFAAGLSTTVAAQAGQAILKEVPKDGEIPHGKVVLVDDGTCPKGEVKEITGCNREKAIPPQASTRIPEALDRLIELFTAINKPLEVAKWRAERAKHDRLAPLPREKN